MWRQTTDWDPEGVVSTLPAIATTLFGVLAGHLLRIRRTPAERTAWLFVCGSVLLALGSVLAWWMPINKSLWTSSYSVFMAGLAMQVFAFCYWLVDVQEWKRFAQPFVMFGMNAIVLFFFSGMLARMLSILKIQGVSFQHIIYDGFFAHLAAPINASLLYALSNVIVMYLLARFLYRRKWFVRF
jgi:predicted acyltransferase